MIRLTDLKYRPGSHDDLVVFKELVSNDMYHFKYLSQITNLYRKWLCIDGGGHIGLFSLLLAKYVDGEILTFEPNPDSFYYCDLNTKYEKKIHVFQKGLDYKNDSIQLYPPLQSSSTGSWSMVPTSSHNRTCPLNVETVNVASLIERYSDKDVQLLLKLDLEGYEAILISNLPDRFLQKVKILILEEHHQPIDHERLYKLGFRCLYHPAGSLRHFVYFNVSNENEAVKILLRAKCELGDVYWRKKVEHLKKASRITAKKIVSGLLNNLPFVRK